jgi:hypothetical protein
VLLLVVVLLLGFGGLQQDVRADETQNCAPERAYCVTAIRLAGQPTPLLTTTDIPPIWRLATQGRHVSQRIRLLAEAADRISLRRSVNTQYHILCQH